MTDPEAAALLHRVMTAAISAADPSHMLAAHLPEKPQGRCIVIGAGKAAASMAVALEQAWPDVDISGAVVTPYGHALPTTHITVHEAAHPVPDAAGLAAAQDIARHARGAGRYDLVIALISGGGSALMPMPVAPLTLDEKQKVNRLLLRSGLAIDDMNRVRRRLSQIKGGGLARAAAPARLVTLAVSDVPGDAPEAIASGPTVPDPSAMDDLSALVARLGPDLPQSARAVLMAQPVPQPDFDADYRMIAAPQFSLEAAAQVAQQAGITPLLLGDALEGEAREMGVTLAGMAKSVARHGTPIGAPCMLLSGGEGTVTIGAGPAGRGGRNTEFLLSLAIALDGAPGITALAVDTDGIDGTEDAAGACVTPTTLSRAMAAGLDPKQVLAGHDSYVLFDTLGDLIKTGPTLTNVNDFRAILIR